MIAKLPSPCADDPARCLRPPDGDPSATPDAPTPLARPTGRRRPRFDLPPRRWGVTLTTVTGGGRRGIQHFTVCAPTAEEALAAAAREAGTDTARRHRHDAVVDLSDAAVEPGEPSVLWPEEPGPM
ncbi:hypothetical protein [Kitasatospora sp. NPDC057015]|uniref:hypothetical protein n=1 Tax=Kitasatospora sp. NPDC057015 TaxID=3346001 RepID=UPI0036351A64